MRSPGTHRVSLRHDGLERSYLLYLPPDNGPLPLVMMLHGAGGSADFARVETGWTDLAKERGFAVVFPEALAINPAKASKFFTNPQEWHDGSGRGKHDDVEFLTALLCELSSMIDPK